MTETVSALLPCPFCGEQPELYGASIECVNSDCWGPAIYHFARAPDTVEAWNRRATPSRNDILEEAARVLAFYRDAWALGHDNFIEPSQALLADCGDRARAAIRALVKP